MIKCSMSSVTRNFVFYFLLVVLFTFCFIRFIWSLPVVACYTYFCVIINMFNWLNYNIVLWLWISASTLFLSYLSYIYQLSILKFSISAYHHWCCEFKSPSGRDVQHCVIKFCQWLVTGQWFPPPIKLTATI